MSDNQEAARQVVRDHMAQFRWSNTDLARRAGVDVGTINDFLAGKRWPRPATLAKIDEALQHQHGTLDRVARGSTTVRWGDDPGVSGDRETSGVLLDLDLSDLDPAAREEVYAAARLRALEKAREIRRSLEG